VAAAPKPDLNQGGASRRRASAPALSETCLTSLSALNRLVRTRMLGGVGRAVSNGRPYPIRQCYPFIRRYFHTSPVCQRASTPQSSSICLFAKR